MEPGRLSSKVIIEEPFTAQDALGQIVPGWLPVALVWADIRYGNGLEAIRADAQRATTRVSIRIRYRSDLTNLTTGWRLTHQGNVYDITGVLPDVAGKRHVDLLCEVAK